MVCLIENPSKKRLSLRLVAAKVAEQSVKEWSSRSKLLLRGSAQDVVWQLMRPLDWDQVD
jgi:3-deoxy-D-manno-octulosonic-acid transferase